MRAVMIVAWVAAIVVLLLPWLRPRGVPPRPATPDQLVKDPVCQTYIVRSRAVTRWQDGETHYFCSARCADQFVPGRG